MPHSDQHNPRNIDTHKKEIRSIYSPFCFERKESSTITMADNDNDPNEESLAQQALSVYCDEVVRDADKKNKRLQVKNAKMEAAREKLIHMTIYYGGRDDGSEMLKINIGDPTAVLIADEEDPGQAESCTDDHDLGVYDVEASGIQFPFSDINSLTYAISNVGLSDSGYISRFSGAAPPELIVNEFDETVQLEFYACRDVKMIATLTNFAGTIQDVQEMADSNRFLVQCTMMGMTRGVENSIDNSLDGAIACLKTIEIKRSVIHDIILLESDQEVDSECLDEDPEDNELHVLARANQKHLGLLKAATVRKQLKSRRKLLQESRDVFQTVTCYTPRDNAVHFQLRLDEGYLGKTAVGEEAPAWVMRPFGDAAGGGPLTLDFSAIAELRLKLANISWGTSRGPAFVDLPQFFTNGFVVLRYAPHVEAIFCFDESLEHLHGGSLEPAIVRRLVYAALINSHQAEPYQGPHFTMKLISIHVRLHSITSHLDALGIDYSSSSSSSNQDEE
jgi:hypothetical protein